MGKKRGRGKKDENKQDDLLRQVVHGVLSLVLGALATWLAGKLTDLILGPAETKEEEQPE